MHPYENGKFIRSPGGSFLYKVIGPCCRLFDREELPWPSCRLSWKGKEPSWNRIGKRFVPDLSASRCPSYSVRARDMYGNEWNDILTFYSTKLKCDEKAWWYSKKPQCKPYPDMPNEQL